MGEHGLVLITCGEAAEARAIARRLVESHLVAGVQIMPIESIYRWGGEVVEDQEWLLIAKTRSERFDAINDVVSEMHSYEVPPVLIVEMARASRPYRDWIDKS